MAEDRIITESVLTEVLVQDKEYNAKKFVAKKDLKESESGNLTITKNDKTYELLGVNSLIDVNKLNGVIGVEHIPNAALERVIPVVDQEARFNLTEDQAQLGDVIKENDSGKMFFVTDLTNLDNASGYMEFSVGTAANVSWENVSNKPALASASHTHTGSDITTAVDKAVSADNVPWTGISGKPGLAAASHTHSGSEIVSAVANATNAANVPWTGVSNKPAFAATLSVSGSTLTLNDSDGVSMSSVNLQEGGSAGNSIEIASTDEILEGVFGYNMNPECTGKYSPDGKHSYQNGYCVYCGESEN